MRSIQMRAATAMARAAGAAIALGSLSSAALGQTYTWVGMSAGNFNDATKWQSGVAPAGSNNPATALVFNTSNGSQFIATNNISGSPFQVNSLAFNVNNVLQLNASPTTTIYQLVGPSPSITMSGVGTARLLSTGGGVQLTTDLTINIAGPGNLDLSGAISDDFTTSNTHRALTIAGLNAARGWSFVNLGIGNSFSGGLTLDGGVVTTGALATVFGPAGSMLTVTSNGGSIGVGSTFTSSLGTLQLSGDVRFLNSGSLTLAGTGGVATVVQGSGTLYQNMGGSTAPSLTINGNSGTGAASPFTGAVVIDQSVLPNFATAVTGTVTLGAQGGQNTTPNGSLNSAASFDVRAGGSLTVTNSVSDSFQNGDRIGDTTPVRLRSGNLNLNGPASALPVASGGHNYVPSNLTEVIGAMSGAGNSTITANPTTGTNVSATIQAGSLTRLERGTFNFRGPALGDGATLTRGRITLTNPLAGTEFVGGGGTSAQNVSILPYAVGGTSNSDAGNSLITYGADGFRPLATTEYYSTDLAPTDPTVNVRITTAVANNGAQTINALVLGPAGAAPDSSVTGAGTLTITSGTVVSAGTHGTSTAPQGISNNLAFGAAEAVIFTSGPGGLKITGQMSGTNGLTKASNGTGTAQNNVLTLTADNSGLTGPLTINGGYLEFASDINLPGSNSVATPDAIIVNGSNVSSSGPATGLFYTGASPVTLNRPIAVNTGMFTILMRDVTIAAASWTNIGSITFAGPITGVGGMNYQPQTTSGSSPNITTPGDIYVTGTSNTYSGVSRFAGGITHVYGEGSLGTGAWEFNTGTMVLEGGDQTNSRYVDFSGPGTIDTNGHNLTLNGPITGLQINALTPNASTSGVTKKGLGALTLNSPVNTLVGTVTVSAGSLIVNGNLGGAAADTVTVAAGATLGGSGKINRAVTVNGTLSPGNSPGTLSTQNLALNGNLACDIVGTSAADLVNVTGTVTLGAASELDLAITGTPSGPVIIVQNDGTDAVTGTFATVTGLPAGATINYAFTGTDSLGRVGDGNDIAVVFPVVQACYANCDGSTTAPVLNVGDFTCFLQKYAAGDPYANCDGSTVPPVLNVGDFTCFLQKYAAGCP
jgi:autotransporter-associated beta strand protein